MGDFYDEPDMIEVTSLSDNMRTYIPDRSTYSGYHIYGTPSVTNTLYPYTWGTTTSSDSYIWTPSTYEELVKRLGKEEELKVRVDKIVSSKPGEHIMVCQNKDDLVPDNILVTLSAVKGRLMFDIAPIHIKEMICSMTPQVKANLITAGKRLKMYGKKAPIVPNFDEYGRRLPDIIEIGDSKGITVNIVDPKDHGELYFELKAIEFFDIDEVPF